MRPLWKLDSADNLTEKQIMRWFYSISTELVYNLLDLQLYFSIFSILHNNFFNTYVLHLVPVPHLEEQMTCSSFQFFIQLGSIGRIQVIELLTTSNSPNLSVYYFKRSNSFCNPIHLQYQYNFLGGDILYIYLFSVSLISHFIITFHF